MGDAVLPVRTVRGGASLDGSSYRNYALSRKPSPAGVGLVVWETQCSVSLP
ncbi:hypothetical protein P4H39_06860 [Paenibacillus lautus]|uniref:hypothetical protein n=1 Tax=Paenibacillus lautus TaxID=1401 RepID=UPI002DB6DB79|nr:hypothetical protein [Paenibacillus lautus]MEC0202351.1 hypothetical protein [Paenibacillus lautus]